ncbi:MAG: biotin/lipoyl-binding protein [Saccharofermentans sp.]|jgi:biotin carboxyl carrier protein|nr:biotin/lipoyl-binding protein [Clostridiales bacterium]MCR5049147.1 biotin/lipoyl-binding protein [Saccharofermentans sp.]
MIYNVTINDKVYEVEVEKGKANLIRTTAVQAAPAPAAAPVAAAPAAAPAPAAPAAPAASVQAGTTPVNSPMPGTILDVKVAVGQAVKEGDLVVILEAMKMENEIYAPCAGTVAQVLTSKGASVDTGAPLVTIS